MKIVCALSSAGNRQHRTSDQDRHAAKNPDQDTPLKFGPAKLAGHFLNRKCPHP
jgi:hypothetical protein